MNNRVIYSDNGSLQDLSVALNNYNQGEETFNYIAGEDFLFIGARLPFNNIFFKLGTPNTADTVMKVEYWNDRTWVEVVELIDETNGFKSSGAIQFTPNRDESWAMDDTNYKSESITGLSGVNIYDRYWIRISFSQDLLGPEIVEDPPLVPAQYEDVKLDWCGNVFSNDYDLGSEYPDLVRANVITAYKAGTTSYEEQHVSAAKVIIQDLINKRVIKEKGQILEWREFTMAAIHKVAEIIFTSMGDDYVDQKDAARDEYKDRMSKDNFTVDQNNDAIETPNETFKLQGFLSR